MAAMREIHQTFFQPLALEDKVCQGCPFCFPQVFLFFSCPQMRIIAASAKRDRACRLMKRIDALLSTGGLRDPLPAFRIRLPPLPVWPCKGEERSPPFPSHSFSSSSKDEGQMKGDREWRKEKRPLSVSMQQVPALVFLFCSDFSKA